MITREPELNIGAIDGNRSPGTKRNDSLQLLLGHVNGDHPGIVISESVFAHEVDDIVVLQVDCRMSRSKPLQGLRQQRQHRVGD